MKWLTLLVTLTLALGCSTLSRYTSDSQRPEIEVTINAPIDVVWENALRIIPMERMILVSADENAYQIIARKKGSTFGGHKEAIILQLAQEGERQTLAKFRPRNIRVSAFAYQSRMIKNIARKLQTASEKELQNSSGDN